MTRLPLPALLLLVAHLAAGETADPLALPLPGGANRPEGIAAPPALAVPLGELACGAFTVRVPTGRWTAPAGGVAPYSIPGPIAGLRLGQGPWLGHGYLETVAAVTAFSGEQAEGKAEMTWTFDRDRRWTVTLTVRDGVLLWEDSGGAGVRDRFVFDATYGWQPSAGFALGPAGGPAAYLDLPCLYDKNEVAVRPADLLSGAQPAKVPPAGLGVYAPRDGATAVLGVWARRLGDWKQADRQGFGLWQRRQLPGDPGSRHVLGPDTKADAIPDPAARAFLGASLYEGHVTLEFALGGGTRHLGWILAPRGADAATPVAAASAAWK